MLEKLKLGTVCSGVGAPEVAYEDMFNSEWCSEYDPKDPFPSEVLAYRFSGLKNLGDMTKLHENEHFIKSKINLLVGGTPCQGFSVAGKQGGLKNDDRAKLTLEFVRILQTKQPQWFIWENVPGVFSSWSDAEDCKEDEKDFEESWDINQTNDLETFLGAVQDVGYGVSWRVLDAQNFGVPQRRRRIYVVGYLGDWRPSYRVLFESESLPGNIKKSGCKGKESSGQSKECAIGTISGKSIFPTLAASMGSKQWLGNQEAFSGDYYINQVVHGTQDPCVSDKAFCLGRNNGSENAVLSIHENQRAEITLNEKCGTLKTPGGKPGQGYPAVFRYSKSSRGTHTDQRAYCDGTVNTLNTGPGCSNQSTQNIVCCNHNDSNLYTEENLSPTIRAGSGGQPPSVVDASLRKLTPLECERLQGFPDNWTKIPYRNKEIDDCPKSHRYKAMGNSMAVPVMRWIGKRLNTVDMYIKLQS